MSQEANQQTGITTLDPHFHFAPVAKEMLDSSAPHQRALLHLLAVADRYGLCAADLVSSLASDLPRDYRYIAIELADCLREGKEPVDALEEFPNCLPTNCLLALRLAREEDKLPILYDELLRLSSGTEVDYSVDSEHPFSRISRLIARVFIFALLSMLILMKIVPEFLKMFEEFGVEPPGSLRLLIMLSDVGFKWWFVLLILLLLASPFLLFAFRGYLRRWNPLTWHQRRFAPAVTRQRSLALITHSELPTPTGIELMSRSLARRGDVKRLDQAQDQLQKGQNEWDALAEAKVISPRDAATLNMSSSRETQAWLLRWSAAQLQDRRDTRIVTFVRICAGLVNVAIALLVALTCVSVFMTLIQIMASLN